MIPANRISLDGNEAKYLAECVLAGWISSDGPFVARLEHEVARLTLRRHAIAVTSGSVALDLAVAALGIGCGDEVILSAFTALSCAAAVVRVGAIPVVVDCEPASWNIDPSAVEAKVGPRTRAIMAAHTFGLPVDMDPIREIATRYGLEIIEESAHAIGQIYWSRNAGTHVPDALNGGKHGAGAASGPRTPRLVGSLGEISTLSFSAEKHAAADQGGMVLTNDDRLAARCRSLRSLSRGAEGGHVCEKAGWDFRMRNPHAAIEVARVERLSERIAKKREIGGWYNELLRDLVWLERLPERTENARHGYSIYAVVLGDDVPINAREAMRRLAARGVETRPLFCPLHRHPALLRRGLLSGAACPVADRVARRGFSLPSGLALRRAEAEKVADAVRELFAAG